MTKNYRTSRKGFQVNESYEAEPLRVTLKRAKSNNEPIAGATAQYFTERADGVRPEYDIRTDRFDVAMGVMDRATKAHIANREDRGQPLEEREGSGATSSTSEPA